MNYVQAIADTANRYGVDPRLAIEVATQESNLNPDAVSGAGAMGLFQLMPATAAEMGVDDPFDPLQNIDGGVRYLAQQLNRFGALDLALAAYNWGPGNLSKALAAYSGDWFHYAPRETQNYVTEILGNIAAAYRPQITPGSFTTGVIANTRQTKEENPEFFRNALWTIGIGMAVLLGVALLWGRE